MTFSAAATQDLTGKVAIVTGATSGLGRRFAQILSAAGATLVVTGRRVEKLESLTAEIKEIVVGTNSAYPKDRRPDIRNLGFKPRTGNCCNRAFGNLRAFFRWLVLEEVLERPRRPS